MNCETWWPFCMKHDHSCHGDPCDHAHLPLLHGPLLKQSWNFPVPGRLRMGREVYADFLIKNLGIAWKSACHAGIATPDWARDSKNAESNVAGKDIDPNPAWILGSGLSTLELGIPHLKASSCWTQKYQNWKPMKFENAIGKNMEGLSFLSRSPSLCSEN